MPRNHSYTGAAVVLGIAAAVSVPGFTVARAQVPTREGNIWNGQDHEPMAGQVRPAERAAGVAAPPAVQQRQTEDVEGIYHELMRQEQQGQSGGGQGQSGGGQGQSGR